MLSIKDSPAETQLALFDFDDDVTNNTAFNEKTVGEIKAVDPHDYDRIVVFFSGGKDSIACVLHLIDQGVPREKIELHHHDVDGREGSSLMDWPVTRAYCKAFAEALGLKLYFSWKKGGIEGEMLRDNSKTAPVAWETPEGVVRESGGTAGKMGTRRRFPQVSADLRVRWCSVYAKIDIGARIIATDERFRHGKTLVVTGERAEESASRARYKMCEPYRADNRDGLRVKRWVDQWRPVHQWSETEVWEIMRRYGVNPHPCYWLGWSRCSCLNCIFGSPNQWASSRKVSPVNFYRIAEYEREFGSTIHRKLSVIQQADKGVAYEMNAEMMQLAMGDIYPTNLILMSPEAWQLPLGAFGEGSGPI